MREAVWSCQAVVRRESGSVAERLFFRRASGQSGKLRRRLRPQEGGDVVRATQNNGS